MAITGLVLFGSYARGDVHEGSDVDLLGIVGDDEPLALRNQLHLRLQLHTQETLQALFANGSLFAWHLASEGRIVYDCDGLLATLFGSFALRSGYATERARACNLGWLLIDHGVPDAVPLASVWIKTVLYVARTVGLTHLAERNPPMPCFSRQAMCDALSSSVLDDIWAHKAGASSLDRVPLLLAGFLEEQAHGRPTWMTGSTVDLLAEYPEKFDPVAFTRLAALLGRPDLAVGIAYI